jgi:hypothetical protein
MMHILHEGADQHELLLGHCHPERLVVEAFPLEPMYKVDGARVKSLIVGGLYGAPVLVEEIIIAITDSSSRGRQ